MGGGTNIQSKHACVLRYKLESKTRAKPEEPVCRSSHWAVQNTKNQGRRHRGPVVPAPPFHIWSTGWCVHPIMYFKNVPTFWFLTPPSGFWPLLINPGLGLQEHSLKNKQKWHSIDTCLNTFKITTFIHLEHKSIRTEYSFYNCIRYRNAKKRQSTPSN